MEVPGKASTICQPCSSTGEQVPAKSFCEDCNEYLCHGCCNDHRKFAVLRHHKLTDALTIDTAAQQQQQQQRGSKPTTTCKIHVDKLVEFYCRDHNVTVCGACAVVNHIRCKPEYIPDLSKHYKDSDKYRAVRDELENLLIKTRTLRETTEKNIELTKDNVERTLDEIKRSQQETIDNVNSIYEKRITKARTMQEEDTTALCQTKNNLDLMERELVDTQSYLSNHETQSSDLFIAGTNVTTKSEQLQTRLREFEMNTTAFSYMFDTKIKSLPLLGPITRIPRSEETGSNEDDQACFLSEPLLERTVNIDWNTCEIVQETDLDVRTKKSNIGLPHMYLISSIHLLDSNTLVMSDYGNFNIIKFDIPAKKEISCLYVWSNPWQITKLSKPEHIAVSFPSEQKLRIISTTGNLTIQRSIEVNGCCRGLCSTSNGNLVVSFIEPAKFEVITLHGNVVYSLLQASPRMFRYPFYLITENADDREFVIASDRDSNTLIRIPLERKTRYRYVSHYKDDRLIEPRSLTSTGDGHFLVCGRISNNIQVVSTDGKKVRDLLTPDDNIDSPHSICYDKDSMTIYIGCNGSFKIRVYRIE